MEVIRQIVRERLLADVSVLRAPQREGDGSALRASPTATTDDSASRAADVSWIPAGVTQREEIVLEATKEIAIMVEVELCRAGWSRFSVGASEAITADQMTLSSIELLREALLAAPPTKLIGRVGILLRQARNRMWAKASGRLLEPDEAQPEPNWPDPCERCHQRTIYFRDGQTRSSDEPSTLFFKCLNCGWMGRGS